VRTALSVHMVLKDDHVLDGLGGGDAVLLGQIDRCWCCVCVCVCVLRQSSTARVPGARPANSAAWAPARLVFLTQDILALPSVQQH
jgi:hypothetical protein